MHIYRPILTQHRVRRLALWALAMLQWIAAIVFADRQVSLRHIKQRADAICLHALTRLVGNLIIARALLIARPRRRLIHYWRHGRDLRRTHFRRSLFGSKLRRALNDKDLARHIAKLIAALRNLDRHARRLAHCMRHSRRRLWRAQPAMAPAATIFGAPVRLPALADSS
jgi:hypothetical protein